MVSLSLGTMSMRDHLEKSAGYIEVDAPKRLSRCKRPTYRIDAGKAGDADIRLRLNGGEARVYSILPVLRSSDAEHGYLSMAQCRRMGNGGRGTKLMNSTLGLDRDGDAADQGCLLQPVLPPDIYGADDLTAMASGYIQPVWLCLAAISECDRSIFDCRTAMGLMGAAYG